MYVSGTVGGETVGPSKLIITVHMYFHALFCFAGISLSLRVSMRKHGQMCAILEAEQLTVLSNLGRPWSHVLRSNMNFT